MSSAFPSPGGVKSRVQMAICGKSSPFSSVHEGLIPFFQDDEHLLVSAKFRNPLNPLLSSMHELKIRLGSFEFSPPHGSLLLRPLEE